MKRLSFIRVNLYRVIVTFLAAGMLALCAPASVYAVEELTATGVVHNDKLNVRRGPSTDDEAFAQLEDGDTVDITGVDGDWYRIEYDEEVGYVSAKYVEIQGGDSPDDETDDANTGEDESTETEEDEEGTSAKVDVTTTAIIAAIILLLVIIIFATVKSIRNLSDEDDYYEDDYYPDYEDDYREEDDYPEEEDDYPEDEDNYPEDDDYDEEDDEEDEEEEYDGPPVRRRDPVPPAMQAVRDGADPAKYMSDNPEDYKIDIDPKYFEKTATLPDLTEALDEDDEDAPEPIRDDPDAPLPIGREYESADPFGSSEQKMTQADKDAQLAAAYKKMEELREELERIKNEQT